MIDNDSKIACERLFMQRYDEVYSVDSYFEDLYVAYNQLEYNMSVVNEIQRIKEENKLKEDEEYKECQRLKEKFENK